MPALQTAAAEQRVVHTQKYPATIKTNVPVTLATQQQAALIPLSTVMTTIYVPPNVAFQK